MPTKIKSDYQPSQRVYELLKAFGVQNPVEFVGHEMGAFMMYWEDTGKAKCNWDSTCLTWMKRTYEDKKHAMAQNRSYSGQQENIFQSALEKVGEPPPPPPGANPKPQGYRLPDPPEPGKAMSSEEAFDQLRGILK